jgi:NAD(P)H-quinone oxidoreductase subunit 4
MGFVLLGIASFTDLGVSGALLQMISHGLIASVLFFLAGVTYDRTHTLILDKMGGIGQVMPKVFALFTASAMASLALPGMSGFISELSVFVGITSSDIYSHPFRTLTVILAAVGLILTPIYLLSMLRQLFFVNDASLTCEIGDNDNDSSAKVEQEAVCFGTNCVLPADAVYSDAKPREVFIAACFLVLIIGIGMYPKLATQMYDAKTVALNAQARQSYVEISQMNPHVYANNLFAKEVLN